MSSIVSKKSDSEGALQLFRKHLIKLGENGQQKESQSFMHGMQQAPNPQMFKENPIKLNPFLVTMRQTTLLKEVKALRSD